MGILRQRFEVSKPLTSQERFCISQGVDAVKPLVTEGLTQPLCLAIHCFGIVAKEDEVEMCGGRPHLTCRMFGVCGSQG